MIQVADEPLHYYHKIGFTSSESMSIFLSEIEKYGMECDDIDFDHDYCEAICSSEQSLNARQMADIVLSGNVCYVVLNSVVPVEEM